MSEPFAIVDDPDSPSGKSLVVRSINFFLVDKPTSLTDEQWVEKLQAKADRFAIELTK